MRTIGVELEYADVQPKNIKRFLPDGWETLGDSSIRNSDRSWSKYGKMNVLGAEVRTIKGQPLSWYKNGTLSTVLTIVQNLGGIANATCGMHIHIGTFTPSRERLLSVADYFYRNPVARLAGTSSERIKKQCSPIDRELLNDFLTMDLDQLVSLCVAFPNGHHNFHRQREVNALSLLKYGTIEYRMFASTLDEQHILTAMEWCLALTDAYLNNHEVPLPKGPLPPPV